MLHSGYAGQLSAPLVSADRNGNSESFMPCI